MSQAKGMDINMKILVIRTHPTEININTYNVQEIGLAKALIAKGHTCDIMLYTSGTSRVETLCNDNGKNITLFWKHGRNFFWQGLYNKNELMDLACQYDIIQVNEYNQIASFYITNKLKGKSYIYHGPYFNPKDKKYNVLNKVFDILFLKKMKRNAPLILTKSKLAEHTLIQKGFRNVVTVGVGVDVERLANHEMPICKMHKNDEFKLLYIGEISERRNILFLLDVFARVVNRINKNVSLTIVGNGKEEYVDKCKKLAKKLQIIDKIDYRSKMQQEELSEVYKEADIFLFPTNYEIFGMVLLEAMLFGVPIVSSVNGGSTTLIDNENEGVIINDFVPDTWANAVVSLLTDTERRKKMSRSERKNILQKYTWYDIADKIISAYEEFKKTEAEV